MMLSRIRLGSYLCVAALLGFTLGQSDELRANNPEAETYRMLTLLGEAYERVRSSYVEAVEDKILIEAAIKGMMSALDPYSGYLNEDHFNKLQDHNRGQFGGLGLEVTMDENGYVRVVSPIDDTPAARAGMMPEDLITHINGEDVIGLTLGQAVEKMRGGINTTIDLGVLRDNTERLEFKLTRQYISVRSVRSRVIEDNIGYVRITGFSNNTSMNIENEINKLDNDNTIASFIIDLRNNPGGLLDEAVKVSDGFLERGEIVSIRGRDNKSIQRFQANPGDWTHGRPLVVLINRGSASASEILGGALQDHERATLIGDTSFGKGSVQTIIPLQTSQAAIKLTTQYYYTPSGESISKVGLKPDISVDALPPIVNEDGSRSPPLQDVQLDHAVDYLQNLVINHNA